jgi:hypothetical protein
LEETTLFNGKKRSSEFKARLPIWDEGAMAVFSALWCPYVVPSQMCWSLRSIGDVGMLMGHVGVVIVVDQSQRKSKYMCDFSSRKWDNKIQ